MELCVEELGVVDNLWRRPANPLVPSDRAVVVVYLLIAAWTAVEPQFGFEQRLPGAPEPSQSSFRRCEQSRASRRPESAAQPALLRPASRPTHPPGWSEPGAQSCRRAPCSTAPTRHASRARSYTNSCWRP